MKRQQWIVIGALGAVFVLLGWAGWWFAVKPVNQRIEEKLAEKTQLEDKLKDAKAKEAQYEKFQAEAENVRRGLQFVSSRLDPDLKYSEMFRTLDSLGNSFNLPAYKFRVRKREKSKLVGLGELDEIQVDFSFRTDYESLGRFLNGLVSQQRLYVPQAFTRLKRYDDTATFKSSLDVELDVRLYLQAEAKKG